MLNSSNEDRIYTSGVIQQESKQASPPAKVINLEESYQDLDNFPESEGENNFVELPPKSDSNPYNASDTAIQQEFNRNSTVEFTALKQGDFVKYAGKDGPLGVLCGRRKLEILEISEDTARVKHEKWVVAQTVPIEDLRQV